MKLQTIVVSLCLILMVVSGSFALQPRIVPDKPAATILSDGVHHDLIELKFVEGSAVRLRDGELVSLNQSDLLALHQFLANYPTVEIKRMFDMVSEEKLSRDKQRGEAQTNVALADLNLWYLCHLPSETMAQAFTDGLNRLDIVEIAYPSPIAEPAVYDMKKSQLRQTDTPDFTEQQGYLYAAPAGVNAEFAWTYDGGRGADMKWIDIEHGWNWNHEDMPEPFFQGGAVQYGDHGVAVVGEVSGVLNDFGVTGIASDAEVGCVSTANMGVSQAIYTAYNNLDEGDVFLIELHAPGPRYNFEPRQDQLGYIAMEWWQSNFDAIQTATSNGVLCTEAAGNGAEDFDDPIYQRRFDRDFRDSRAIICGAATGNALRPEGFTNYGSRLDSFGWGSTVTTTGYGDLYGENENEFYTASFSGTSSASPICTGPVISIQGILRAMDEDLLEPLEMRDLLTETGSPQHSDFDRYIGTRPDLYNAIREIVDSGGINGTITNAETGEPVLNARVEVIYPNVITHTDYTTTEGTYWLQELHPIEYTLRITRYGYEIHEETITIPAGNMMEMNIELTPAAGMSSVSGTIESISETPLEANLRFYEANTDFSLILEDVNTNPVDGSFSVNLPAGTYDVHTIVEYPYPLQVEQELVITADTPLDLSYVLEPAALVLVDDDEGNQYESYFTTSLENIDREYYWWDVVAQDGYPTPAMINQLSAPMVLWFTGDAEETAVTPEEADLIVDILNAGSFLFLTGQNIAEYLGDHPLLTDYLEVSYVESFNGGALRNITDDEIGEQLNLIRITNGGAENQTSADVISPSGTAAPFYYYVPGSTDRIGAIHNENTGMGYKLVFFSFGFEGIVYVEGNPNFSTPDEVMTVILDWLYESGGSEDMIVSGTTTYWSEDAPIAGVAMDLTGEQTFSDLTDLQGNFAIQTTIPGDYTLTAEFDGVDEGSIGAFDAAQVAQFSVDLIDFNEFQIIAGDVTGNGEVSAYDASRIARYAAGIPQGSLCGEWTFSPSAYEYTPLVRDMANQDFTGILYGEVSGDWSPAGTRSTADPQLAAHLKGVQQENDQLILPLQIDHLDDGVIAYEMTVHYDPQVLDFQSVLKDDTRSHQMEIVTAEQIPGHVRVVAYGVEPLAAGEVLLKLVYDAVGDPNQQTEIVLENVRFNDGDVVSVLDAGMVKIAAQTAIPTVYQLKQNYPNPFNPRTTIEYDLPNQAPVSIRIYDVNGRLVKTLCHDEIKTVGRHTLEWNGTDDNQHAVQSGIYFYQIDTNGFNDIKSMVLLR